MAYDTCLHPDLIDEMIEELFEIDIISKDQMKKLKSDQPILLDPNVLMDVRHKEVKKESLIEFNAQRQDSDKNKLKIKNIDKEPQMKVKDLKTIDKEILNTRRCIEDFKKKLEQKNEELENSISDLEKENNKFPFEERLDIKDIYSPILETLNREETVQIFNLHLDNLEHAMSRAQPEDNVKTWRPLEAKSPAINDNETLREFEEESEILDGDIRENISFHVNDTKSYGLSETQSIYVPLNSPFNVSVTLDEKYKLSPKQRKNIQKVISHWKFYAKKKRIQKWSDKKASKLRTNLLKKYVFLWSSYTKLSKATKATRLNQSSRALEIVPVKCCVNQKKIGIGNICKGETEEHKETPNENKVQTKSVTIKKNHSETISKKIDMPSKDTNESSSIKPDEIPINKLEIHVKTVTPQDVGLAIQTDIITNKVCKNKPEKPETNNMTSRSMGEPMIHRFEAQEKIIKQQREVIEKQKRIIFDLQAKCLDVESKLNWALAERQLAEAESNNKISKHILSSDRKQVQNSLVKHSKSKLQEESNMICKTLDKSDKIVKNMLERQAYCSQLAEQTKQRKKRIEEEKERLKLEQEEKLNKEKEEERKNKILQMKLEQQLAREKEKNAAALRKVEAELTEKALKHYKNNLLRKSFAKLKSVHLEVSIKSEDCDKIYKLKLARKMFNTWKEYAKHTIREKYEFADSYYNEKLLRTSWCGFRKVHHEYKLRCQVSEDLYNFKLQERMFHRWQTFAIEQFLQTCIKIELAERLRRRQLLRHYFNYWREVPRLMFKEREKEQRRRAWRETVQQLIPDFTPTYIDDI